MGETASFDANTGRVVQILAGTANAIASFSYSWDTVGNLASRADTTQGYTENFCYDALNRLTNSAFGAACTGGKTIAYDAIGNLTSKSDTGTYAYPAAGQARPHAVSSITGTVNGVLNPAFAYDADGNMTSGAGRSVTWTSFNLANQVTQGTTTVAFTYDSEHARIVQSIGGASPSTTTYLNAMGAVSEKFVAGTATTWHDYIYAAGSLVAERFCSGAAPCTTGAAMRYAVDDHLGSPSSLTDANGAVTNRLSYDAWGQRRNASGSDAICGTIPSDTTRGFTGHEMMDAVCLVNMNARLYDPAIGRFMSADSVVPDPLNGQTFNRYAYLNGNPLNGTDPTGHQVANSDEHPSLPINPCGSSSGCGDQFGSITDHCPGCQPTIVYQSGYWLSVSNSAAVPACCSLEYIPPIGNLPSGTGGISGSGGATGGGFGRSSEGGGSGGGGHEPFVHGTEFALDAAAARKIALQRAGKFSFRGKILPLTARGGQALRIAKLNQAVVADAAELATRSLAGVSILINLNEAYAGGFSDQAIAKAGVGFVVTGLATFGGPVGLGLAVGITVLDTSGAFDPLYDQLDNTSRLGP